MSKTTVPGEMVVHASHDGKTVRHGDVKVKPVQALTIPIREIDTLESITCGFRQHMLDMKTDDGLGGEVSTGAGYGNDYIHLEWTDASGEEHKAVVRGSELLRAWVKTFDPKAAKRFPEQVKEVK